MENYKELQDRIERVESITALFFAQEATNENGEHEPFFTISQVRNIIKILVPTIFEAVKPVSNINETSDLQANNDAEYIGFVETSRRFGIPPGTLRRHVPNIKHYRRGKRLYFRIEDVEQWLQNGRVSTPVLVNQPSKTHIPS